MFKYWRRNKYLEVLYYSTKSKIGSSCDICAYCFVENDVIVKDNVNMRSNLSLWVSTIIENKIHLGSNIVFTKDLRLRS